MVAAGIFHPEERLELVDGEIVQMSPQGSAHATAVSLLETRLRLAFGASYVVRVQMPLALDPASEPEPDVAVVVGAPRDYRDAHPQTAVMIVEVADATLGYDRERKANLYARTGIQEYWILNLQDRQLEVHTQPAMGSYQTRRVLVSPQTISPLGCPHAAIAVADLLP